MLLKDTDIYKLIRYDVCIKTDHKESIIKLRRSTSSIQLTSWKHDHYYWALIYQMLLVHCLTDHCATKGTLSVV